MTAGSSRFQLRVVLTDEQRREIERGRFVVVPLGALVDVGDVEARTALVGRAGGAWRAYANVCRHHAVPLDFGMGTPMADDGRRLLCHQHGALYRPEDGACIGGPCTGMSLEPMAIDEDGDALLLRA
jgi:nitrite reductase/ring-hydroxylating ferredoxin subunit